LESNLLCALLALASAISSNAGAWAAGVIEDPVLDEAVRQQLVALGADPGPTIEAGELKNVGFTSFTNNSGLIYSVKGLEYATDLTQLDLSSNVILDVTPLAFLTNLTRLDLSHNGETITPDWLRDLSPLRRLVNLTELDLSYNRVIQDISPLQDLVNLRHLELDFNDVRDIGPLARLINLTHLHAAFNSIQNISVLKLLPGIVEVDISNNDVIDLAALDESIYIGSGDIVLLAGNPLSDRSTCTHLASMLADGVITDLATTCGSFTVASYESALLELTQPAPETLAAMDLNEDGQVDVADLVLKIRGQNISSMVDLVGQSLEAARTSITNFNAQDGAGGQDLWLGEPSTAPSVRSPVVRVLAQSPVAPGLPGHHRIDTTVSIPPDPFVALTLDGAVAEDEVSAFAYYAAIDPGNAKDTLEKWIHENGFGSPDGTEAQAVYFNSFDLGFGRNMRMRQDPQRIAFYVTNHDTVDEAWQDPGNPLATVAMEFSPHPLGGSARPYVKFYAFDRDGYRITKIDLDGRGEKYIPGMCIVCHGGKPQPLQSGVYPQQGRTGARFIPFDLDTFGYTTRSASLTRSAQGTAFKAFNRAVRDHLNRLETDMYEFQSPNLGAARTVIEGWYGGSALTGDFDGSSTPSGWTGNLSLYHDVFAQSCRNCHLQQTPSTATFGRDTLGVSSGQPFATLSDFSAWSSVIKSKVYVLGSMPKATRTFKSFWLSTTPTNQAFTLANFVDASLVSGGQVVSGPGRPNAVYSYLPVSPQPGSPVELDGTASLFSIEYRWNLNSRPFNSSLPIGNSAITSPFAPRASFTPDVTGVYQIQLTTLREGFSSVTAPSSTISVGSVRSFANDVVPLLNECKICHYPTTGNGGFRVALDATTLLPTATIYTELTAELGTQDPANPRVLTGSPSSSMVLKKVSQNGVIHGGGYRFGFASTATVQASAQYQTILLWIQEGAANN
jgi:hypothetical protein